MARERGTYILVGKQRLTTCFSQIRNLRTLAEIFKALAL